MFKKGILLWLDLMGQSYYLNVYVEGKKLLVISATYVSFNTLRDVALYNLVKINVQVEDLRIPDTLKEDVLQLHKQLEETKFENVL